jgi:polyketide cyclase/dehydrase/lipid transport protein
MQRLISILVWIAAVLVGLFVVISAIGMALPKEHTVSRSLTLRATVPEVYGVITDHAREPEWRTGLKKTERIRSGAGEETWRETYDNGQTMTLRTTEFSIPIYYVREVADRNAPFSGKWIYRIQYRPEGGCTVTITEMGKVPNPFFRFMSKFVFGQTGEIDKYLKALAKRLGEEAPPQ